jgi:peptide/nickel transport system ATP-binding protein
MRQYPHELSGGMRQRVMIAMATACGPDLLIADEPTTALDVTVQAQILELLQELRRELGMAIVLITHDLGVVAGLAERVLVMYAGRIVEEGPADDVLDRPLHPYTKGLIASVPGQADRGRRLTPIPGMAPSLLDLPAGCAFRPRCPRADDACLATPEPRELLLGRTARCWHPHREAA